MIIDDAWALEPAQLLRCGGQVVCLLTTRDDDIARDFAGAGQNIPVPELDEDPSLQLLASLAPEACKAEPEAMRQLAEAVGGLPLALELIGGYLGQSEHRVFSDLLQQALAELQDPQRRLELEKGRLDTIIGLSLDHLQETRPDALPAFYALGAFAPKPARFQRVSAEAVAETNTATLALLIARNLLEGDGDSLALHQTLAAAAAQHCPEAARQRHRDHYLALVNEDRNDWQRIELLYPQILHAWKRQMAMAPDDEILITFVSTLKTYQQRRGLWRDLLLWLEQALSFAKNNKRAADEALLWNEFGYVYDALGEKQKALDYYDQALPLSRQVGDRGGEATTLNNIGMVYDDLGEKQKALDYYEQALPLRRQVGDRGGEANTLNNIGAVHRSLGEMQKALDYYEQALPLRRQVGDRGGEATTLNNIGAVYRSLGEMQKALDYFQRALALSHSIGDVWGEIQRRWNIGDVYMKMGELDKAETELVQAVDLAERVGHPSLPSIRKWLAQVQEQKK